MFARQKQYKTVAVLKVIHDFPHFFVENYDKITGMALSTVANQSRKDENRNGAILSREKMSTEEFKLLYDQAKSALEEKGVDAQLRKDGLSLIERLQDLVTRGVIGANEAADMLRQLVAAIVLTKKENGTSVSA